MATEGVLKQRKGRDAAEAIRQWWVECPLSGGLAEVGIRRRDPEFGISRVRFFEIVRCGLWAEIGCCAQKCINKEDRN